MQTEEYDEADTYDNSEPLPVILSTAKCRIHGFRFVSYPRDRGSDSYGYIQKCPLKACGAGI